MALRNFRRYSEIKAVYLRRGGATGRIQPLISDIDFVIIERDLKEEDKEELIDFYERLAKATTILDQSLEIYNEKDLLKLYDTNDYFQFRFTEGKETWKLLLGTDYLADLPNLPIEKMYGGFFTEIKVWWSLFAWRFFQSRKYNDEPMTQNNVCFKTVSEILKMNLALNHDHLIFDRIQALQLSNSYLSLEEQKYLERLNQVVQRRFRSRDDKFLEDTKVFIICYLNRFYKEFMNHSCARPLKTIPQQVDCAVHDAFLNEQTNAHLKKLVKFVKERWSDVYLGSYWVHSAYFNMDEILFMVKLEPTKVPSVDDLCAFYNYHCNAPSNLKSRIRIFLLYPYAAFQIDPEDLKKSWQSILCPPCNPDVFELLGRPEFCLEGNSHTQFRSVGLTALVEHFFWEEELLFYELLENPLIYKLNSFDFLRIFWKTIQLVLINKSIQKKTIHYPLTLNAIERALEEQKISIPHELRYLKQAYLELLLGKVYDISNMIPKALNYLREIKL
jgi:hypothetical protein